MREIAIFEGGYLPQEVDEIESPLDLELLASGIRYREGRVTDRAAFFVAKILNTGAGMKLRKGAKITERQLLGRRSYLEMRDAMMGYDTQEDDLKEVAKRRAEKIMELHKLNKAKIARGKNAV